LLITQSNEFLAFRSNQDRNFLICNPFTIGISCLTNRNVMEYFAYIIIQPSQLGTHPCTNFSALPDAHQKILPGFGRQGQAEKSNPILSISHNHHFSIFFQPAIYAFGLKGFTLVGVVGFAVLTLFCIFPIICKLCVISLAFSGTQPTLRHDKFQSVTSNRTRRNFLKNLK